MKRKKRSKAHLGFVAVVISLFVFCAWYQDDLITEIAGKPKSLVGDISDGSFTRRNLLAHKTHKLKNCTPPSIGEFPNDMFNQRQRQHGAVVVNFAAAFYMFWAIAIVCDDYFVPCLEIICDKMGLQSDVAGATFMALGSSAPELFASVIGVFVTHGDIGVGTILGSAVFNVLFVIGVCGIGAGTVLYLAWWPLVRDSMFYLFSLVILMLVLMDNIVVWSEATAMVCSYSLYLVIMFFNPRIEKWLYRITNTTSPEFKSDLHASNETNSAKNEGYSKLAIDEKVETSEEDNDQEPEKCQQQQEEIRVPKPFEGRGEHLAHHYEYDQHRPHEVPDLTLGTPWNPPEGVWARFCWLLGFPINLVYYYTIPDVKKESCQKYVGFSFVVCIIWIGVTSYILVWMVTIIGYTFMIPDTVMGLSLVAFGSSVPDCLSSLFVAQKGDGDMAVSHTVGSNVFDILLCLGIPWLVKTTVWDYDSTVVINSHGLFVSCFFILGSIAVTLLIIYWYKWVLNKKVGCIYLVFYFIFLGISIFVEMRAFAKYNPPMCIIDV
ncbi:sodium/potassium/calcium exchanger 4-like [Montipora capricornis]|uniref:sodium/potassium/calcium exchanger 4-like n=1 Tax=Montipora capricornis TaxID=246305 RepID=UPI0035F1C45A